MVVAETMAIVVLLASFMVLVMVAIIIVMIVIATLVSSLLLYRSQDSNNHICEGWHLCPSVRMMYLDPRRAARLFGGFHQMGAPKWTQTY